MAGVYDHPKYYEVAFSFRNIPQEVDVFEECIRRYARVPVKTFLELACGNGPHLNELIHRNYRYIGLDLNEHMLEFTRRKISNPNQATLSKGDLCRFTLKESAEFAFIALGSLFAKNTADLIDHFRSVAGAISPGGLYLLDWCVYFSSRYEVEEKWEIEQDEILVQTTVNGKIVDPVEQIYEEAITLEVTDNRPKSTYKGVDYKRIIYPQEFLLMVEHKTEFEFIGWWNNWNLGDPLPSPNPITRPIVLLRRR
ncbi:MAG: class I SAM-dependent methyltransferase [Thermodesulfobacteriota bacterium]